MRRPFMELGPEHNIYICVRFLSIFPVFFSFFILDKYLRVVGWDRRKSRIRGQEGRALFYNLIVIQSSKGCELLFKRIPSKGDALIL
jgi:hypothetical protein